MGKRRRWALASSGNPPATRLVVEGRHRRIPRIQESLPRGMKIELNYDSSVFIAQSIKAVFSTIGEAVILVAIVIFFFLRSLRATIIPLITIPVAPDRCVLHHVRVRLHDQHADAAGHGAWSGWWWMTLSWCWNIHRHIESGMGRLQAALIGTRRSASRWSP